jgi:hypothetical protein
MSADSYRNWEARAAHYQQILDNLRSTAGVVFAAATFTAMPLNIGFETPFEMPGHTADSTRMTVIDNLKWTLVPATAINTNRNESRTLGISLAHTSNLPWGASYGFIGSLQSAWQNQFQFSHHTPVNLY